MMGVQNRREDEKTIRGYQDAGYTEADYTAPTPQEVQAGYRGAAPGQYKGEVYDKSRQVSVAGRQFQRPVEPKMSYKVVKKDGRPMLEVYQGGNLSKVSAMSQAAKDVKGKGWQRKIDYFAGKGGKSMAQKIYFNSDPDNPQEFKVGNPYEVKRGTGGGGASIQLIGFDEKDPKGKRPVTYNPKSGKISIGKPVTGLGDVTKKTTNVERTNINISKAKQKIEGDLSNPAVKAEIEYLQKHDTSDTVYVWKTKDKVVPFTDIKYGSDSKAEAVKLPVLNGKQVTTQDIRDTMKAEGMTFEQVLEHVLNAKSR